MRWRGLERKMLINIGFDIWAKQFLLYFYEVWVSEGSKFRPSRVGFSIWKHGQIGQARSQVKAT